MSDVHLESQETRDYSSFLSNLTAADGLALDVQQNVTLPLGFGLSNDPVTRRIIHYSIGFFLVIVGILGIIGNVLVLFIFTRYQRLRSGGGPLILSLATGDLMVALCYVLPAYSSFVERWAFGKLGCDLYAGAVGLGGFASLFALTAIAADRFCVIFGRPVHWLAHESTCACIWGLSLCFVLPPYLGWSEFCLEGLGTSCSWNYTSRTPSNRLYYVLLLSFGFGLPVTIIIISYIGILRVVLQHSRDLTGFSRNGVEVSSQSLSKKEIKTAQVVFTLIICFLVSWTPYAVVSFIGQFGPPNSLSQLGTALPAIFAKASVIYNPIIYGISHPHFRSALMSIWGNRGTSNRTLAQNLCYQNTTRALPSNPNFQQSLSNSRSPTMIRHQGRVSRQTSDEHALKTLTTQLRNESGRTSRGSIGGEGGNGTSSPRRQSRPRSASQGQSTGNFGCRHDYRSIRQEEQRQHGETGAVIVKLKQIPSASPGINYSAPDLHRDDRIVRNPNLITQTEYQRRKQSWLWKVLFRSESRLDHVLRSDGYDQMAKLGNREIIILKPNKRRQHRRQTQSPRHYPHAETQELASVTVHSSPSGRSSSITSTPAKRHGQAGRRSTEPVLDEEVNRKKSTTSILHRANQSSKRDSNLLALPLRFEDGIPSGEEGEEQHSPASTRRSSSGRKSSSSGSKGSGAHGRKSILDLFSGQHWFRRKSSGTSEGTGVSHYTSQRSGSQTQSKKFSIESSVSKHQWKYFLMHQRDCCECSFRVGSTCPQDQQRFYSFDYTS